VLAFVVFTLTERLRFSLQNFGSMNATVLLGLPFALALLFYLFSLVVGKRR
jgi:hypothetical protein